MSRLFPVLALSTLCQLLPAADWPHFQGPTRNGTSTETGLLKSFPAKGPETLWETPLQEGFGGAAVVGDEVFIADRAQREKDMLLCLDLATGKEKWRFEHPSEGEPPYPGSRNVPTVEADAAYFIGSFGDVFRLNRESQKPDWHVKLSERYPDAEAPKWGYAQCPLVVGDLLIVTPFGTETGIAAWDKKTGKEVWKSGPIGSTHSSPTLLNILGEEQLVIITAEGTYGFNPADGTRLWHTDLYQVRIPIPFPTLVGNDRLFLTGGYDAGSKFLKITKKGSNYQFETLWELAKGSQIHPPQIIGEHLYMLANENSNHNAKARRKKGGLTCIELASGKELWSTGDEPFMGRGGLLHADGALYIQDGESGVLRAFKVSPEGPEKLAEANVFQTDESRRRDLKYWSPLALSQGHLLLRGQDRLLCLKLKP
ncbi:MAG: PQQ-binding-like beta-propeller repeat protein [Verrucomicrobiales bacterium]